MLNNHLCSHTYPPSTLVFLIYILALHTFIFRIHVFIIVILSFILNYIFVIHFYHS